MAHAIEVHGLQKSFGPARALAGLDLIVRTGEVHAFLGPNGAGKTTTLRILLGLLKADGGEARLLGAPVADVPELARAASPITHVRAGAPPFLIAHGTADRAVPFGQSEALAAALAEAGADVRLEAVHGADHMWAGVDDLTPLFDAVVAFAREVAGG